MLLTSCDSVCTFVCVCLCFGLCEREKEVKKKRQDTCFIGLLSASVQPAEEDVCTNFKLVQLGACESIG